MSDSQDTASAADAADAAARLAGRLQHGVAGPLDAIAARLDALMIMTPDAAAQRELGDAAARLRTVTGEVRTAIAELRLGDGDPTGLTGRVRALALAAGQRLGCTPKIALDGPLDDLDDALIEDVTAVADEALTNVVRHAYAGTIEVVVRVDGGRLTIEVRDDGVGPNDEPTGGTGLPAMRASAERHGGEFSVEPNEPMGTALRWSVPTS